MASRTDAIERITERPWAEWAAHLDDVGARDLTHYEIATLLHGELEGKMPNHAWWAQGITVAYEQHIGRRLPGQRSDGTFQTSVSRATKLGMTELMEAWKTFAAEDAGVQELIAGEPRVSGTEKRITWRVAGSDGASIVVMSEPRKATASIIVQHNGAPTLERNVEVKELWGEILDSFARQPPPV